MMPKVSLMPNMVTIFRARSVARSMSLLAPLVIVWYIIGELGSLAEHAVTFGAPVPSWLCNILEIGKNAVDAAGESIAGESGGEDSKDSGE